MNEPRLIIESRFCTKQAFAAGGMPSANLRTAVGTRLAGVDHCPRRPPRLRPHLTLGRPVWIVAVLALGPACAQEGTGLTAMGPTIPDLIEVDEGMQTVVAVDPLVSILIRGGVDEAEFSGPGLSFRAPPDFEAPADADRNNRYALIVSVGDAREDRSSLRELALEVVVRDVDEPPEFQSPTAVAVPEGTEAFVYSAQAVDPEGAPITFRLLDDGDAAAFELVAGGLRFIEPPDFERPSDADADNVYRVRIEAATDGGPSASQWVDVEVTDGLDRVMGVQILFPTANANLGGVDQTWVAGTFDPSAAPPPNGVQVTVNGVVATFDPERPRQWRAQVSVPEGQVTLEVQIALDDERNIQRRRVANSAFYTAVMGLGFARAGRAYVADDSVQSLFEVDLETGVQRALTPPYDPLMSRSNVVTFANDRMYFLNQAGEVVVLDVATGERTTPYDVAQTTGPRIQGADAMVLDAAGQRLIVLDYPQVRDYDEATYQAVLARTLAVRCRGVVTAFRRVYSPRLVAIDLRTGGRTVLSRFDDGPEVRTIAPNKRNGIAFDADSARVFVGLHADLVSVDLTTGRHRTIASTIDRNFRSVVFDAVRSRLIGLVQTVGPRQVEMNLALIDLEVGRIIPWGPSFGQRQCEPFSPVFFGANAALAMDGAQDRILVATRDRLLSIDPESARSELLSNPGQVGFGPPAYGEPSGIDEAADVLYASDAEAAAVYAFDLQTGNRTEVSSAFVGSGPALDFPIGAALDALARRLVLSTGLGLWSVAVPSGDRAQLTSEARERTDIHIDGQSGQALVSGFDAPELVSFDLTSEAFRTVVEGSLYAMNDIHRDPGSDTAWLAVRTETADLSDGIVEVDLMTGALSVVSGGAVGSGPELVNPTSIDRWRSDLVAVSAGRLMLVDPQTGRRRELLGTGPELLCCNKVTVRPSSNMAFIAGGWFGLMGIDLHSGQRIVVSR